MTTEKTTAMNRLGYSTEDRDDDEWFLPSPIRPEYLKFKNLNTMKFCIVFIGGCVLVLTLTIFITSIVVSTALRREIYPELANDARNITRYVDTVTNDINMITGYARTAKMTFSEIANDIHDTSKVIQKVTSDFKGISKDVIAALNRIEKGINVIAHFFNRTMGLPGDKKRNIYPDLQYKRSISKFVIN